MCYNLIIKKKKDFWWFYMLKECKIIREKMCKINRQSLGYNTEQVFDKCGLPLLFTLKYE